MIYVELIPLKSMRHNVFLAYCVFSLVVSMHYDILNNPDIGVTFPVVLLSIVAFVLRIYLWPHHVITEDIGQIETKGAVTWHFLCSVFHSIVFPFWICWYVTFGAFLLLHLFLKGLVALVEFVDRRD